MGAISIDVPYREIQQILLEESENYVKRIREQRRYDCLMAAGDVLDENGYLPNGTVYRPVGDELVFFIDKGNGVNLANYFHEGWIYGPNFFVKKLGEWRSYKGRTKEPEHEMDKQGQYMPSGVAHWTEALVPGSDMFDKSVYNQLVWRIEEILRK